MKKFNIITFCLLLTLSVFSQEPNGYYSNAEGNADASLKTALFNIIKSHTVISYDGLWTAFKTTDKRSDGKVWDIYSNTTNYTFGTNQCGSYSSEGNCYNREHSFPKSWFNDATPMYSDLFHLYPSDGYVNGRRSNFPFGEVGTATYQSNNGYCKLGSCNFPGYSGTVFEPANEFKGDLARTYFYMVTAYEDKVTGWNSEHLDGAKFPALNAWSVALFLKWNAQDPVSQKEINRNNTIYADFQHNRNPFIDHPELAEYIWGNKKGQTWTLGNINNPYISSPLQGSTVDFGKIPYQQMSTKTITVSGANLTGDLSLSLSGTNVAYFSIPVNTISQANAQTGYSLTITYNAQSIGNHTALLTISGGGLSNAVIVNLSATASDSFLALPATEITTSGFTANWTSSVNATNYLLDVYSYGGSTVTSKTLIEEDFNSGLPSGWTSSGYTDNTTASNMRLASGSNPGAIITPAMDLSISTVLTVRARQYGTDTGAKLYITSPVDTVTVLTTSATNQDFTVVVSDYTTSTPLTFSAVKGSRVYIDYIKLATEGSTLTPISVSSFPKLVGNVQNYQVLGLESDSTYYYTVTPQGNSASISDVIKVNTLIGTDVNKNIYKNLNWYLSGNILHLINLPENCKLKIFDVMGKSVGEYSVSESNFNTILTNKGLYIIQISYKGKTQTKKIIY